MTNAALRGKPDAGNPHVRFDEGEVAPAATPRRGSLLYNKAIQKIVMALAVCGALCGTAMAAPKGNPPPKGKAPTAMKAPAQKPHTAKAPAPAKHTAHTAKAPGKAPTVTRHAPMRPASRHEVAHHASPPPPHARHHEPRHHHDCHHSTTLHTEDWCEIGASLLGGLVGGLIGASI